MLTLHSGERLTIVQSRYRKTQLIQGHSRAQLLLTGGINLMNVTDPTVLFRKTIDDFNAADMRFSNRECCLYAPPGSHAWDNEGFFAAPGPAGESLKSIRARPYFTASAVSAFTPATAAASTVTGWA